MHLIPPHSGIRLACLLSLSLPLGAALITSPCHADTKAAMRVLRDECLACHKPGKAKGGLLLNSPDKMMAGGDNGTPIVPGKAEDSLLYQVLLEDGDPHMPPKKQLPAVQVTAFKQWINAGAPWDGSVFDEPPTPKKIKPGPLPPGYQPVLAIALSPDEKQLAVACGNSIRLLDLSQSDPPELGRLEGHLTPVEALVWTPDGKQLISGGHQELLRWDAITRTKLGTLEGSLLGNLTAMAIDQEGKSLYVADAVIGGAGFIRQFDLTNNRLQATWKGHDDTIYALKISPDNQQLLTGSADKLVKLWNRQTRQLVSLYEGHTNHVLGVDFNHDGSQIASTGADMETKIWDVKSKEQVVSLGNRKTALASLDWNADGRILAVINNKGGGVAYSEFKVHDGAQSSRGTKEQALTSVGETLTTVCISKDGKTIYAGSFEGKVHRWDATNGKPSTIAVAP
jgi:WD40 repeat protein